MILLMGVGFERGRILTAASPIVNAFKPKAQTSPANGSWPQVGPYGLLEEDAC
jgi:hypothetical protein